MDLVMSIASAAAKIGPKTRGWLLAMVLVTASLAVTFTAAVIWDFTGRITTVRSESGEVEINLNTRTQEIKR